MEKSEAISKAIDAIKGREVQPGTIVAHRDYEFATTFLRYDGEEAVVEIKDGSEMRFPKSEIFEANKIPNIANHFLNLGFWKDGMESMILTAN